MRARLERRIRKRLRSHTSTMRGLAARVGKLESGGTSLQDALLTILLEPSHSQSERAAAGKLFGPRAVDRLLEVFFRQRDGDEVYCTALTLEELNDHRAIGPLIQALRSDENVDRRRGAARALGWMRPANRAAARALAACLTDGRETTEVREEAAESLAYVGNGATVDAVVSVLGDADVRVRFWAVFALGGRGHASARTYRALESMLGDEESPLDSWWAVGREALAMLSQARPPVGDYEARLEAEVARIKSDPAATAECRRWAEFYG